ncbi:MAG: outer membrane lipoprotein-sorting protein [Candidatus Marinimicrobia bacterium]|nr:outer membrane lipoprotein-sorting protein [Candidatus Neomarinimicrobiota bacterium]
MKKLLCILLLSPIFVNAQPDGTTILKNIDENLSAENMVMTSTMVIHGRRTSRSVTSKSWIQGEEKAFTEYLKPAREAGTKMLKLEDQLWTYSPDTDRTIRIAGHMLRQSLMGSDLSYEDMMEDSKLSDVYTASVSGEEEIQGRPCWVLDLTATSDDVAYHSRKMWVDKERMISLKEHRYAKSGKLLKTSEIKELLRAEGRWYPKRAVYKDALSQGDGTEFIVESIEFNVDIPDYIFSRAALRR